MEARRARPGDWLAIEALNQRAGRRLPRLWWWEECLAEDLFIVVVQEHLVMGVFLAWPDGSPVAWVRLAALDDTLDVGEWLSLVLSPTIDRLRCRGAHTLAWMDYGGWVGACLGTLGFRRLKDVVTLAKRDRALPELRAAGAQVRPVSDKDIPAIVAVDRAAFTPHWWHSADTMRRVAAASSHFVVAELADEVVGYAEGGLRLPTAHLNRIAVHPAHQGQGIGAALLRDVLRAFWQSGAEAVTLNTQSDNRSSQRLYRRFGFEPTGHLVTAWELPLYKKRRSVCRANVERRRNGASPTR